MDVHEDLLVADFNQCFEQMRHYDESFRRTLEFSFGLLASVIAGTAALLGQYGATVLTTELVGVLLLVSSFASLLLVVLMARNRVYFAVVARFVNEVRGLYLGRSPGGFANDSRMYCDHRFPRIFDPGSTQAIQLYFLSVCNAFLFGAAITLFHLAFDLARSRHPTLRWYEQASAVFIFLVCEFGWVISYWRRKQARRTANTAVFGR